MWLYWVQLVWLLVQSVWSLVPLQRHLSLFGCKLAFQNQESIQVPKKRKMKRKLTLKKIVTIYRHRKAQKALKSNFGYIKLHFASMVIIETFQQNVQIITHFLLSLHNRCQILRLLQASRQSKSELQFYTGCPNKF